MPKKELSIADRVKTALMGDLSHADRSSVQAEVSAYYDPAKRTSGRQGRIYGSFDVGATSAPGRAFGPLAPISLIWTKIRSIGEYDAARTR